MSIYEKVYELTVLRQMLYIRQCICKGLIGYFAGDPQVLAQTINSELG